MALTNFILTVTAVSAAVLLFRTGVKQSASIFSRNVRQIHHWLEEESANAAKSAESVRFQRAALPRTRMQFLSSIISYDDFREELILS